MANVKEAYKRRMQKGQEIPAEAAQANEKDVQNILDSRLNKLIAKKARKKGK
jgi:hypothetical protein